MKAFRIADGRHPLFDGTGAFLTGGRWNSRGRAVMYAATTYAGALLEQLAHANIGLLPATQAWIEINIPPSVTVERLEASHVPGWNSDDFTVSRAFGDRWLAELRTAVLVVPSAVTAGIETNLVINPRHPHFANITVSTPRPVEWDPRLVRHQP